MICRWRILVLLLTLALSAGCCYAGPGRSYSSGGHSYSSHSSSSHSSGFSGSGSSGFSSSRSSGGGSSRNSSNPGSKSFTSGSGKSYSSGSSWNDDNRKGYSSSKSYTSGTGKTFSSAPDKDGVPPAPRTRKDNAGSSGFSFDTAAARARKEEVSKEQFTKFKQSQNPAPIAPNNGPGSGSPYANGSGSYRRPVYVPEREIIRTRPVRVYNVYHYYNTRPWITYRDPYSSFFWWWLLDRALDDRAWWAYNHRYDMDPARYQALLATDAQLQARVSQLEAQQPARNPSYVPPGLDRDLMYSDQYVNRAYSNRPTRGGEVAFWIFGVPLAIGFCGFVIWLIWFKRWQTGT